ncbi:MAG: MMPL family transporter [Thermomicrobiales bacterium]|nr:MMPL family transporter [Thermomicrobiales bacterium]
MAGSSAPAAAGTQRSEPTGYLARWASYITVHPKRVLGAAILAMIVFAAIAVPLAGEYADSFALPGAESQQAYDLLEERFPQQAGSSATMVFRTDDPAGIGAPDSRTAIEAILAEASTLPHVSHIVSPFDAEQQISADGRTAYATVAFDALAAEIPLSDIDQFIDLVDRSGSEALQVEAGGDIVAQSEFSISYTAELVGITAASIILLLAFGSVVAMGLPILTALLGLFVGFMGIGIVASVMDVATFAPAFASMIGIGVGIDYALFVVTRYREGLADGLSPQRSVVQAVDTAGRAVIFAGGVVVISLLGLSAVGVPFITAIGVAAAIVVAAAVTVALVVLPSILALLGRRIDKWSISRRQSDAASAHQHIPFGRRLARRIQETPWPFAIISAASLLILAVPLADVELGFPDAGANPTSYHSRRAFDLLTEGFGPGFSNPLLIVLEDEKGISPDTLEAMTAALAETPSIVQVDQAFLNEAGDTAVINVIPEGGSNDSSTQDLVSDLRNVTIPQTLEGSGTRAFVGGPTGSFLDFSDHLVSRTPYVFIVIIGLSFLLLTVVFRSPVIALKASIMNLLSIAAAFGVIVAVFQWGWGGQLIGLEESQPIAVFMPMFLFAILFGLSMDYEVFLLSRIREYWAHGDTTSDAVANGLAVTAKVITAAAAIMISVFLAFVATPDPIIKQFGLGLAVAILVDATIVRMILVPSTMELLGHRNWWFPAWLDKIVPHVNIEGSTSPLPDDLGPAVAGSD